MEKFTFLNNQRKANASSNMYQKSLKCSYLFILFVASALWEISLFALVVKNRNQCPTVEWYVNYSTFVLFNINSLKMIFTKTVK